eukprot:m.193964 g.193964  ORF g.193964 m.193964 type:complete len:567 (-) comp19084_c0_seq1:280-1980(-)
MADVFVEKYQKLARLAEGSYGKVIKCRDKTNGRVVAIKKFKESEDDPQIRKIALREVKMLMMLKHPNLVGLIEIFRRRRRLHLVFEFIDHTALNELEAHPHGLPIDSVKRITYQVLRGIEFCHSKNVVHRDVKPENVLVTTKYVVKMCDFGFARTLEGPNAIYTDYVATRWYRAPELLVGDTSYGSSVDVWAIGCLFCELLTGRPLWPGESDIDQVDKIIHTLGPMIKRHEFVFDTNSFFAKVKRPTIQPHDRIVPLRERYERFGSVSVDFMEQAIKPDPAQRATCSQLLTHDFFTNDGWIDLFLPELKRLFEEPFLTMDAPAHRHGTSQHPPPAASSQSQHAHPHASTTTTTSSSGTHVQPHPPPPRASHPHAVHPHHAGGQGSIKSTLGGSTKSSGSSSFLDGSTKSQASVFGGTFKQNGGRKGGMAGNVPSGPPPLLQGGGGGHHHTPPTKPPPGKAGAGAHHTPSPTTYKPHHNGKAPSMPAGAAVLGAPPKQGKRSVAAFRGFPAAMTKPGLTYHGKKAKSKAAGEREERSNGKLSQSLNFKVFKGKNSRKGSKFLPKLGP